MKNLNKLFVGLYLMVAAMIVVGAAHASVVARSPKQAYEYLYSSASALVTPTISTNAVTNAAYEPGAIYQVVLSSGASGDYVILFDSGSASGITTALNTNRLTTKLYYSSATQNTVITFDPPLHFFNGLVVIGSNASNEAAITYELGRGLTGE